MNVRMVNAVLEDRNRPDFDPESNTGEFIAHIPDYVAHGIRAFTINLQGGFPEYKGVVNVTNWIERNRLTNVVLEIVNEFDGGYNLLFTPS